MERTKLAHLADVKSAKRVTAAAKHQRRQRDHRRRDRRKRGVIVLGIEVEEFALETALARAGFLSPDEPACRADLAAALGRIVKVWVREATRGSTRKL